MVLEAFVLGISGSLPLPHRGLSSVLLRREGHEFLFDCGEGVQISMRRMNLRWKSLHVICISHSHADHVTGLPGILMLSSQVERTQPLTIICPKAVKNFITAAYKELGMYINYEIKYILLDDIETCEKIYQNEEEGYDIFAFAGNHTRSVWGFSFVECPRPGRFFPERAKEKNVPIGPLWGQLQKGESVTLANGDVIHSCDVLSPSRTGRKVSYVTDTRPTAEIARSIANSDIVFCESMFKNEHIQATKEKYHMTGIEAGALINQAGGVKQVGLLHFSPRYLPHDIAEIEKEYQSVYPHSFCCKERMRISIPYNE